MFKNYMKIAFRNLLRHRLISFINIFGLAIGLACCILILLFVQDELKYDTYHERSNRIYRVVNRRLADDSNSQLAFTPAAMGPTLKNTFPEVQESARLFIMSDILMEHAGKKFFEENFFFAEPAVFSIFSFPLVKGNPATALLEPNSLVLTRKMATKYFGNEDPLGKTLRIQNETEFKITGVMENLPRYSHLKIDFLGSFSTMYDMVEKGRLESWVWQQFYTYVLLPAGYDPQLLEAKLPGFISEHADPQTLSRGFHFETSLQPLTDIYLHSSQLRFDIGPRGNISNVYTFSIIAVFILLIACINFMNLSTSKSLQRAKEVGLRKVIGASRTRLIRQFLGESILMAFLAVLVAIVLVEALLLAFNEFTGKNLEIIYQFNSLFTTGLLAGTLLLGLLAGSYPAFFLSAFKPIAVLKGSLPSLTKKDSGGTSGSARLRKSLVVFQFAISIFLIIGTAIVFDQLDYMRNKNLGFDQEEILQLPLRGEMSEKVETVKAELLSHPSITHAAASYGGPGSFVAGDDIRMPGSDETWPTNMLIVDYDYIETYQMKMVAGRSFSGEIATDASSGFILNESAAKGLGWTPQEAIGQEIWWDEWASDNVKKGRVIGVVKDFHFRSLHQSITPLVIHIYPQVFTTLSVKVHPEHIGETLSFLEQEWQKFAPEWPFEYHFLDATLDAKYKAEVHLKQIFSVFAFLAIFVACLGLFGLASYTIEHRTKEVGVRKVLGASVSQIILLLSKEFTKLVLIALLIAAPLAYFAAGKWLQKFAYRIKIGPEIFLFAGFLALLISWATVSYQAIKAARKNPVKSLRYE